MLDGSLSQFRALIQKTHQTARNSTVTSADHTGMLAENGKLAIGNAVCERNSFS